MCNIKYVEVGGHQIATQLLGEGESLIVLLHGGGVTEPILEFKAVSNLLAKNYKVLVIELFGYGLSDCVKEERTTENIVFEIHEVISAYHYNQYILMGHSISGIYALHYAKQYPDEVLAFVGIDSSVPKQNDTFNVAPINLFAARITRFFVKTKIINLLAKKTSIFLPVIDTIDWSSDEIEFFKKIFVGNSANDVVINELQNADRNFKLDYNTKFSETMPVLFFLSQQTCRQIKDWEELHHEIIQEREKSKILIYEGSHFLHYTHPKQIADETCTWLNRIGL